MRGDDKHTAASKPVNRSAGQFKSENMPTISHGRVATRVSCGEMFNADFSFTANGIWKSVRITFGTKILHAEVLFFFFDVQNI